MTRTVAWKMLLQTTRWRSIRTWTTSLWSSWKNNAKTMRTPTSKSLLTKESESNLQEGNKKKSTNTEKCGKKSQKRFKIITLINSSVCRLPISLT